MKDDYELTWVDTALSWLAAIFPTVTAAFGFYQNQPWPEYVRHTMSALVAATAAVGLLVASRAQRRGVMMQRKTDETLQKLIEARSDLAAEKGKEFGTFGGEFVKEIAKVSLRHGLANMHFLRYEYAMVLVWMDKDDKIPLAVVRATNEDLDRLSESFGGHAEDAARAFLCEPSMPKMPDKDCIAEEWNSFVETTIHVLLPVFVEGFNFSKRCNISVDHRFFEFYSNVGEDDHSDAPQSFCLDEEALSRFAGLSRLQASRLACKTLIKEGFSPAPAV